MNNINNPNIKKNVKQPKTKRKLNKTFYIFLGMIIFLLAIIVLIIKLILSFRIQNIYIIGNKLLNDEYILDLAEIEDYPSYVKTKTGNIRKKILTSPYISEVKVNKHFLGVIEIEVKESKVLFYKEYDKKYLLDNGEELDKLDYNYSPVILTNYVPSDIYESFVKAYKKIDENVQSKISQIKYDPNEFDNGRFLFYMNDGNYVYITITKMDNINYYNSIIPTLNDEKGTLYLDSGNHFVKF